MVDPELEELRREFLAEADEKVREMESGAGNRSPESLARVTYLAHQLKGSGGSYGFQLISDEAAAIEKAAEEQTDAIDGHIAKLREEIDRRAREHAR